MKRNRQAAQPHFLSGWKDIAKYLGKGVRTVQRYEGQFGLPVRRPSGHSRGSVVAMKPELDVWVQSSPLSSSPVSKAATDSQHLDLATIADRVAELHEEMMALRAELKSSIRRLRENMTALHEELDEQQRRLPHQPGSDRIH